MSIIEFKNTSKHFGPLKVLDGVDLSINAGEVVVLVDRGHLPIVTEMDLEGELKDTLKGMSMRDAVDLVTRRHGVPRRQVYQLALKLGNDE